MTLQARWKFYWAAIGASVFGVTYFRNWLKYRDKGIWFQLRKSACDSLLLWLVAAFWPPLLVALCVMWVADSTTKRPVWRTIVSTLGGMCLGSIAGVFLEVLLVIGAFAMDLVTGDVISNYRKRRAEEQAAETRIIHHQQQRTA